MFSNICIRNIEMLCTESNGTYGIWHVSSRLGPGSQKSGILQRNPPELCKGNIDGLLPCKHHIYSCPDTLEG